MAAARLQEYRYRLLVPMTHEQYLDEPMDIIEWTLRIDDLHKKAEQRRREPKPPGVTTGGDG